MIVVAIQLFCIGGVLLLLGIGAMGLRCFVRIKMLKTFGLDDYLMVTALVFYILEQAFVFHGIYLSLDAETRHLAAENDQARKSLFISEPLYVLAQWFLKLSLGAFLLRFIQSRAQVRIVQGILVLFSLFSMALLLFTTLRCIPVNQNWKPSAHYTCVSPQIFLKMAYTFSVLIGTTDLIFAFLPVSVVWSLSINTRLKVSLAAILGLGVFAGITSFVRLLYLTALRHQNPDDITPKITIILWSCIEPGVGIFIGSVATLRPLFQKFLGGSRYSSRASGYPKPNGWRVSWPSHTGNDTFSLDSVPKPSKLGVLPNVVEEIESRGTGVTAMALNAKDVENTAGIVKTAEFKT